MSLTKNCTKPVAGGAQRRGGATTAVNVTGWPEVRRVGRRRQSVVVGVACGVVNDRTVLSATVPPAPVATTRS